MLLPSERRVGNCSRERTWLVDVADDVHRVGGRGVVAADGEVVEVHLGLHLLWNILPVLLVGVLCKLHHGTALHVRPSWKAVI